MDPYTIGAILTFLLCLGLGALVISRTGDEVDWTVVLCIFAVIFSLVAAVVWPITMVVMGVTLGMMAVIRVVRKGDNGLRKQADQP